MFHGAAWPLQTIGQYTLTVFVQAYQRGQRLLRAPLKPDTRRIRENLQWRD
jgi:hypothetical protein